MKKVLSVILSVILLSAALSGCSLFAPAKEPLALDKTELSMTVGDTVELSAGGAVKVNWSSSNDKIAAVNGGVVSAKSAGSAVITATVEDGSSQSCNVTVTDKLIASITLDAKSTRLGIGKTIQLSAAYTPVDASDTNLTWSSSDESVAMVNSDGYVTGIAEGVANIICSSSNGVEASCTVTVDIVEVPTVAPSTEKPSEKPTEAATEKASANKEDDDEQEATAAPSVSSGSFIFPDSSVRYLTEAEVDAVLSHMTGASVSGDYAQDAVNEIFARNGYVFRTPDIRAYYESQPWYHADPSFGQGDLSEIEIYNITLFQSY